MDEVIFVCFMSITQASSKAIPMRVLRVLLGLVNEMGKKAVVADK